MTTYGKLYDEAIRRVREALPHATVRRSGAVVRVDVGPHTAYMMPETINELDDMGITYLVEGLIYGRRN